ncbi:hypothetical protein [Devosia sp. RR2S18]|uniref:hypothetical protein n=1 Tax=Devosia rhizosphaerae TaxID=3049774 RepID=UPI00254038A9|nr:hypothetical protein [Devosia sp. RR2S18]WIJ26583.1 hypothetical protein QOV41_07485 [Devosia sp. RR2S18]
MTTNDDIRPGLLGKRDGGRTVEPGITRRALLAASPAIVAIAATPAVADRLDNEEASPKEEYAVQRVNRLAQELSEAMDEWMVDIGFDGEPGLWKAHIYPSKDSGCPVSFEQVGRYRDPIIDAIRAYEAGMRDYRDNAPDDEEGAAAYVEKSYGPALRVLETWDKPAVTRFGAMAALRLAVEEAAKFAGSDSLDAMLAAALAYLEKHW